MHASPVKETAQAHRLLIKQPETWDASACNALAQLKPDLGIVVAYGLILPEAMLKIPRLGCVNLHASLLPRWRGAAPVARAIEAGDKVTGVSLMRLVPQLDAGPIVARRECPIQPHDTAATLGERLATIGAQILDAFLRDAEHLLAAAEPQGESGACYARKLSKQEADVDWRRPAAEIERKVRALNPWPVAQTQLGKLTLRIWESEVCTTRTGEPGHVVTDDERLLVHCGRDTLEIKRLQTPGRKILPAREFLNGHDLSNGAFSL